MLYERETFQNAASKLWDYIWTCLEAFKTHLRTFFFARLLKNISMLFLFRYLGYSFTLVCTFVMSVTHSEQLRLMERYIRPLVLVLVLVLSKPTISSTTVRRNCRVNLTFYIILIPSTQPLKAKSLCRSVCEDTLLWSGYGGFLPAHKQHIDVSSVGWSSNV